MKSVPTMYMKRGKLMKLTISDIAKKGWGIKIDSIESIN